MSKKILFSLVAACMLIAIAGSVMADNVVPNSCTIRKDTGISDCPKPDAVAPLSSTSEYDKQYTLGAETVNGEVSGAICCLFSTIYFVTDWAFAIGITITVIMVLIGAFTIMTAAGNAEKVNSGRNYIMFAAIGLGAALLARAVPAIVKFVIAPGA